MLKNKIIWSLCSLVFFAVSFISCDSDDEEEMVLSRLFRPGSFSRVVDGTNVSLSWTPIRNASYLIEYGRLEYGLPFESIKDMNTIELRQGSSSCQLHDLWGSTRYGIRIKAISLVPETKDSEWVISNFTTEAENIFYPLSFEPVGNVFRIFVKWNATKEVEKIKITNLQLGDKTIDLTSAEIAAGEKTIESADDYALRNGQMYTVSIWLGERKRAEASVTLKRS